MSCNFDDVEKATWEGSSEEEAPCYKKIVYKYCNIKHQSNGTHVGKDTPELPLQPWRMHLMKIRKEALFKSKILPFEE